MFAGFNVRKYRAIIIAIVAFLLLVLGTLGSNFYISFESHAHAEEINMAGRQRMLSQRIAKSLFEAEIAFLNKGVGHYEQPLNELKVSVRVFDDVMAAFTQGGTVELASGKQQYLGQVTTTKGQKILSDAQLIWQPFKEEFRDLKEQIGYFETASFANSASSLLDIAVDYATENDQKLNSLTNEIILEAETLGFDSHTSNIISRQGKLLQQIVKSLLATTTAFKSGDDFKTPLKELRQSTEQFDTVLLGLKTGAIIDEDEEELTVQTLTERVGRTLILESLDTWKPLLGHIIRIENSMQSNGVIESDARRAFVSITEYTEQNINTLLSLMNDLTNDIERSSAQTADFTRQLQIGGILVALLIFAFIAYSFFGQLRVSDLRAEQASRETQQILDTVDQGLFLLDKELVMGGQYSKEMESIFADDHIAGRDFPSYIEKLVSDKDARRVKRFFNLLFDPHKKQQLLGDLNPLKQVSVQIKESSDKFVNKYLRFSFSRINDEKGISKILTSVNDISEEVRLGLELEKATKKSDQQVELLTSLINSDTDMLPLFIKNAYDKYEKINQLLKTQSSGLYEYREKATRLMALIHSVKGESTALSLGVVAEMCHEFEQQLIELRDRSNLSGNDFLSLTVKLDQLLTYNNLINDLYEKIFESTASQEVVKQVQAADWSHLHKLAQDVADRQGKKVSLITAGLDSPVVDSELAVHINAISVQLIRNSIVHGIEIPSQREAHKKSKTGKLSIALSRDLDGSYLYLYKDDGAGINIKQVLRRAVENGVVSSEEAKGMDRKSAAKLILSPDVSTATNADLDGGRGVGMSAVGLAVEELGGKISISASSGKGAVFKIRFSRNKSEKKKMTQKPVASTAVA